MNKKKIIGVIGEQASGKGAAADVIRKHYGGSRLTVSNVLRRTLDSLYIEPSRQNLIDLALVLKQAFGEDVLMKAMLKEVEMEDSDLVIVDGFRMPGDPDPFRNEFGNDFKLIYVTADPKVRYERSVKRGEKAGESDQSYEEFLSKEKCKTEQDIKKVGQTADFQLVNNGDMDELEKLVSEVMAKI